MWELMNCCFNDGGTKYIGASKFGAYCTGSYQKFSVIFIKASLKDLLSCIKIKKRTFK